LFLLVFFDYMINICDQIYPQLLVNNTIFCDFDMLLEFYDLSFCFISKEPINPQWHIILNDILWLRCLLFTLHHLEHRNLKNKIKHILKCNSFFILDVRVIIANLFKYWWQSLWYYNLWRSSLKLLSYIIWNVKSNFVLIRNTLLLSFIVMRTHINLRCLSFDI